LILVAKKCVLHSTRRYCWSVCRTVVTQAVAVIKPLSVTTVLQTAVVGVGGRDEACFAESAILSLCHLFHSAISRIVYWS
jgi:hypothetical protein